MPPATRQEKAQLQRRRRCAAWGLPPPHIHPITTTTATHTAATNNNTAVSACFAAHAAACSSASGRSSAATSSLSRCFSLSALRRCSCSRRVCGLTVAGGGSVEQKRMNVGVSLRLLKKVASSSGRRGAPKRPDMSPARPVPVKSSGATRTCACGAASHMHVRRRAYPLSSGRVGWNTRSF
eukprot:362154-Chlamydomonas_euryale.AAC.2